MHSRNHNHNHKFRLSLSPKFSPKFRLNHNHNLNRSHNPQASLPPKKLPFPVLCASRRACRSRKAAARCHLRFSLLWKRSLLKR